MENPVVKLAKELRSEAAQKIQWCSSRGKGMMTPMMVNEIKDQFIEMAKGGPGTGNHMGPIRETYYKGKPDEYFQYVCDAMGWIWC